jgi:hypothetical protein
MEGVTGLCEFLLGLYGGQCDEAPSLGAWGVLGKACNPIMLTSVSCNDDHMQVLPMGVGSSRCI